MQVDGDRDRTIVSLAIARAWRDEEFRAALLERPKDVLADEGLEFADEVQVRILEDSATVKYVNLARGTSDAGQALEVLRRSIPLPDDCELRVVQSSETVRYFVLPTMAGNVVQTAVPERELARIAVPQAGSTYQTAYAVTTEVEAAETTTTVAAEAEAVIVLS